MYLSIMRLIGVPRILLAILPVRCDENRKGFRSYDFVVVEVMTYGPDSFTIGPDVRRGIVVHR
jgi:hypothetical protein